MRDFPQPYTYEKKEETFNKLLEEALQNNEIAEAIHETDIPTTILLEKLRQHVKGKSEEIWDAGDREISFVEELSLRLESVDGEFNRRHLQWSYYSESPAHNVLSKIPYIFLGIVIPLVIAYVVSGFIIGWTTAFHWFVSHLGLVQTLLVASAFIVIPVFSLFLNRLLEARISASNEHYEQVRAKLGIDALKSEIVEASKRVEQAVLVNGIIPELRLTINMYRQPSYETILSQLSAPGLAEVFDPSYEIPTESKRKLLQLLESMSGGSIGVAGPRGAGKTTLLRSVCMSTTLQIKKRPVLSVMAPAPVEYDARDFILYIFSAVCLQVLKLGKVEVSPPWRSMSEMYKGSFKYNPGIGFYRLLGSRMIFLSLNAVLLIGLILITMSFITAATTTPISTSTPITITISQATPNATPTVFSSGGTQKSSTTNYLSALGINPGLLFSWGLFLSIGGFVGLVANFSSRRNVRVSYDRERYERERQHEFELDQLRYERSRESSIISDQLLLEARRQLNTIRFQQSYSSGWSGTLSLPIALQGAVNSAVSLAQNQLSLPEIIEDYRNFMRLVTDKFTVIIGIDEMDKLESDEKAQQFLNEIKALFGLEHCFYLVSVSESAMSSFERRGLPFRDAFDSSFDDIITVDYLKLQPAERLLNRRVIGLPVPFLCLCYCFSGGLARDLIRVCRNLFDRIQLESTKNTLVELCSYLITEDIKAKLRAASVVVTKGIMQEDDISQFFDALRQLATDLVASSLSLNSLGFFLNDMHQEVVVKQDAIQETVPKEVVARRKLAKSLKIELGAYLYYAVTLFEYFTNKTNANDWQVVEQSGDCDQLAQVHQFFSISPYVAYTMISRFRIEHKMHLLE